LEPPLPVSPEAAAMGKWYHRIELPDGTVTPGDRDQSLVFGLYESLLPADLSASSVLDLGANACGLTIEFAKRGARVTAVEYSKHYLDQAEFVLRATGLRERVSLYLGNVFAIHGIDGQFDIVCYLGLSYHVRHPQLALDVISHRCRRMLLASSQTIDGTGLTMRNRAEQHRFPGHTLKDRPLGSLWGWEPTEPRRRQFGVRAPITPAARGRPGPGPARTGSHRRSPTPRCGCLHSGVGLRRDPVPRPDRGDHGATPGR
jgi:SAM-dependent methyltransferase